MSAQELKDYQTQQQLKQLELNKLAAQKILASLLSSLSNPPSVTSGRVVEC